MGAATALFLGCEARRIAAQRQHVKLARQLLAGRLGWDLLLHVDDPDQGRKSCTSLWMLSVLVNLLASPGEGEFNLLLCVGAGAEIALCAARHFDLVHPRRWVWLARGAFVLHAGLLLGLALPGHRVLEVGLRRTLVMVLLMLGSFVESLEEVLLQALTLCLALDWGLRERGEGEDVGLVLLPMAVFVLGVLPIHVLGVSNWILMSSQPPRRQVSMRRIAQCGTMVSCALPLGVLQYSFLTNPLPAMGFLLLGAAGLVPWLALWHNKPWGVKVDRWVQPNTLSFYKPNAATGTRAAAAATATGLLTAWALQLHLWFLVLSTVGAVLMLGQGKLYSAVQADLLAWLGACVLLSHRETWLSVLLALLALLLSSVQLFLASTKEEMLVHMARENAAEAFLSHAIKQKFASVGSALEQFSLLHRSALPPLLVESINECRLGHSMCYAASIYRKLDQGESRPRHKIGVENLRKQLATTTMANLLLPKQGLPLDANIYAEMDWELFHLVLTELARRRKRIVRVWVSGESQVKLQFHLPTRSLSLVTIQLMGQLRARFATDDVLEVDCKVHLSSPSSQPCSPLMAVYVLGNTPVTAMARRGSRLQEMLGESYLQALSGLRFALVDDNALIRRNFYRLLTQNLGVPPDNILCVGETWQECKDFPTAICEGGVDIAIFDQNLDFDQTAGDEDGASIRGSDLALRAKRLGFTGCMILHSSDAQQSSPDANNYVFHSTVEKTASPVKFATGVAKAWLQFKRV